MSVSVRVGITTIGDRPGHWADAERALGPSVELLQEPVNLQSMSSAGYDDAHQRVAHAAARLVERGATGVMIGGTSFTFYRGVEFHTRLLQRVTSTSNVQVSSTSLAMLEALAALGARNLAVATAYTEDVNQRLTQFLEAYDYRVLALRGMDLEDPAAAERISPEDTAELAHAVFLEAPRADCVLISCGGLRTLDLVVPLEAACKVPVVTSYTVTVWGLARLAGTTAQPGYGRLLDLIPSVSRSSAD
jgi:arylmalonate decarboxylase